MQPKEETVQIKIYSKEWFKDKLIASGKVAIEDLLSSEEPMWHSLREEGAIQGDI